MRMVLRAVFSITIALMLSACGGGGATAPGPRTELQISSDCMAPARVVNANEVTAVDTNGYTSVSDQSWDVNAVRQVLNVFAFGSFATDSQIALWSQMSPQQAIVEIISAETVNSKVSPSPSSGVVSIYNSTSSCMSSLWSSFHRDNLMAPSSRDGFHRDEWNGAGATFLALASLRGANQVRQRIGLWETNYHMVANLDVDVSGKQILPYYDQIMDGHARGDDYQDIMVAAALSPAIATQYGHRYNRYVDGEFFGNEDFAREFHQLFFGILGFSPTSDYTFSEHETITIPQTALALTDMTVEQVLDRSGDRVAGAEIVIGTDQHYSADVSVLGQSISGSNATEKISAMGELAISTSESRQNLPIMIIEHFADNNMSAVTKDAVRTLWANSNNNFIEFLRKYAVSTLFHNSERVKYWSPIERSTLFTNLSQAENFEIYQDHYLPTWTLGLEDSRVFRPRHNVFGGTTGIEAASTPSTFKANFRRSVDRNWLYGRTTNENWRKKWQNIVPANSDGQFPVVHVAEWMWSRFIGDGLDNMGTLERMHIYALLATGHDIGYFLDSSNAEKVWTEAELQAALNDSSTSEGAKIATLLASNVNLNSADADQLQEANYRMGLALNFISSTPYAFGQQGR